jgi:CelD/BcsL family acetyltransferase involved in cellulose biosynthesis
MSSTAQSAVEPAALFPADVHCAPNAGGPTPTFAYGITFSTQLDAFADIWPALNDKGDFSACVLQRRDWLKVWLAAIGVQRRIRPLFVRVDNALGEPLMLLPLAIEKRHGLHILVFLDGQYSDCSAPVLFPGAASLTECAVTELWRQLCAALPPFDAAVFSKMPPWVGAIPNPLRLLPCEPMPRPHCRDDTRNRREFNEIAPLLSHSDIEDLIAFVGRLGEGGARRKAQGASPERLMFAALTGWASDRGVVREQFQRAADTHQQARTALTPPLFQTSLPTTLAGRAFLRAIKARRALTRSSVGLAYRALRARTIAARLIRSVQQFSSRPTRNINGLG